MFYLAGALILFSLTSLIRFLALYYAGSLAERKKQKASAYDIGSFIRECRNKNAQARPLSKPQPQAPQIQPENSHRKLPPAPVAFDSALLGANTLRQYMLIDDYMYDGVSRMSGEQIDNFSDLSSKIKEYSHNSDGLAEGALNKIKGHIAESHAADHFERAGAEVEWPDASNQEGWDLLLNGNPVQIKLIKDARSLTEHFKERPDIPAVIPSDAENIPDTAFRLNPSEGLESLSDFLKEAPENAVIVNEQLSHAKLTENVRQAADFIEGDFDFFKFPVITMAFSGYRELRLLMRNDTDILSSLKNTGLDAMGAGIGMGAGAEAGAAAGTLIFPGLGTAIGAVAGALAGGLFGRTVTNAIKEEPLEEAVENWKKSAKKLKRKAKQSEKRHEVLFEREKAKEQAALNNSAFEMKSAIDEETENLRKWAVEKERPSRALKAALLNNIIVTEGLYKKENLHWTEYFWPKQKTISRQIKIKRAKKFLKERFLKSKFTDRGQLFQECAEHGLCREYILSEIQKTEEDRLRRESDLTKEIGLRQKKILHERYRRIKKLANKTKNYVRKIRKELSPYIKEAQNCRKLVKKEAKKLGRGAAA